MDHGENKNRIHIRVSNPTQTTVYILFRRKIFYSGTCSISYLIIFLFIFQKHVFFYLYELITRSTFYYLAAHSIISGGKFMFLECTDFIVP